MATVLGALKLGVLVAARVAPLTVFAPWISLRSAPAVVRAAVILALTLALAPLAAHAATDVPEHVPLVLLAVREAMVGTVFALASALPFVALDWSGQLVDTWRGASLAEVIAPPTGERTSPLGDLYLLFGVALFAAAGGHRVAIAAFARSFDAIPVGHAEALAGVTGSGLVAAKNVGSALGFAVVLTAPALVAIVAVELVLGFVGRMVPQIPVFFAGMPVRAAVGIAACLLVVPSLAEVLAPAFSQAIERAEQLLLPFGAP
ncbi:MAG: flagellar biosynthetic protein FliR [Myxococcales bacterium]|nr:flagellar biosynthetic protein FliR [Myxococcales bacterium]